MFYFTCNESKIYESFTFWNKLQEKNNFFMTFYFIEMHLYALDSHSFSLRANKWLGLSDLK